MEHKSGRDVDTLNQIARYKRKLMSMQGKNLVFNEIPTMAIIFYNGSLFPLCKKCT